jgi:hypothetical protein
MLVQSHFSSSLILVIHNNMVNWTNHIVQHVFVDIFRSYECKNTTCSNEKIVYPMGQYFKTETSQANG